MIEVLGLNAWFAGIGCLVVLGLLGKPVTRRPLVRLARPVVDWLTARYAGTDDRDRDEEDLWLMYRRRKLCADLSRVEHLLATDTWMSATRQLGNRMAYERLLYDLRHMPDVLPGFRTFQALDSWDGSADELRRTGFVIQGYSARSPKVEVLDVGWGSRKG